MSLCVAAMARFEATQRLVDAVAVAGRGCGALARLSHLLVPLAASSRLQSLLEGLRVVTSAIDR